MPARSMLVCPYTQYLVCTCKAHVYGFGQVSVFFFLELGVGSASVHYGRDRQARMQHEWRVRACARRTLQWPRNLHQGRGAGPVAALQSQSRMGFEQYLQQGQHVRLGVCGLQCGAWRCAAARRRELARAQCRPLGDAAELARGNSTLMRVGVLALVPCENCEVCLVAILGLR